MAGIARGCNWLRCGEVSVDTLKVDIFRLVFPLQVLTVLTRSAEISKAGITLLSLRLAPQEFLRVAVQINVVLSPSLHPHISDRQLLILFGSFGSTLTRFRVIVR